MAEISGKKRVKIDSPVCQNGAAITVDGDVVKDIFPHLPDKGELR